MSASIVRHKSWRNLLPALALAGSIIGADASTWEKLPFSVNEPVHAVTSFDSILIIGTENGVKRSTDGGATWIPAESGLVSGRVTALARLGGRLVAGQRDKLFRSDDGGITWAPASGQDPYMTVMGFRTNGDSVFALLGLYPATNPEPEGKFLSMDGGASWTDAGAWSGNMSYDPLALGGDTLVAIHNGVLVRDLEGGTRWGPIPIDPGWGHFTSLAVLSGRLYATTSGGVLLRTQDSRADFYPAPTDPIPQMRPFFLAAAGERVCASTRHRISCSEDEGSHWTMARNNFHIFENQIMAMGDRYLYVGSSSNWSVDGLRRFDFSAKSWTHLEWNEEGRDLHWHWRDGTFLAGHGERVVLSGDMAPQTGWVTSLMSENHGMSWDSISVGPFRYPKGAVFLSKGWRGMILKASVSPIRFSKEGEDTWDSLPGEYREGRPNDDFIRSHTQITASSSRLFVCGNEGELWKGDMEEKIWSKISTPLEMQVCQTGIDENFTYLAASDSALYASTPSGLWRLPLSEDAVAITPFKGSFLSRSPKTVIAGPSAGSGKVLITPAPSGRARPGTYDFNGIRQPGIQGEKGRP